MERICCINCGECIADQNGTSSPAIAAIWKDQKRLRELAYPIMREWLEMKFSAISEDCYAAVWMHGLEKYIWDACESGPEDTAYGMGKITAQDLKEIKAVSDELGEWMTYAGPVPLDEWRKSCTQSH